MTIAQVMQALENWAPPAYQEGYDNCGLITGQAAQPCSGILCTLDVTEAVVQEAVQKGCNLIVAHHPIVFKGLKKLSGGSYVERTVVAAIKADVAIYALHTSLDHVATGVSFEMGRRLGLQNMQVLDKKADLLGLFVVYAPVAYKAALKQALFAAGAGQISQYSECSFATEGEGSYKGNEHSNPMVGQKGEQTVAAEVKLEVVAPLHLKGRLVAAAQAVGYYEEVAWQMLPMTNAHPQVGAGCVGDLPTALEETELLARIKTLFGAGVVRHTALLGRPVQRVAVCGGSGSFLIRKAMGAGADLYLTADVKYHEFFDADGRLLLADIGHYESEQFTPALIQKQLGANFPTFAPILLSEVRTNPLFYYA